jgi:hypothetical protein
MAYGGGPDPDAFTLDRIGRGRLGRGRGGTTLERRSAETWVAVQRYPDRSTAAHALDEAIAEGGSPTDFRLVTQDNAGVRRLLLIGSIVVGVLVAYSIWQIAT